MPPATFFFSLPSTYSHPLFSPGRKMVCRYLSTARQSFPPPPSLSPAPLTLRRIYQERMSQLRAKKRWQLRLVGQVSHTQAPRPHSDISRSCSCVILSLPPTRALVHESLWNGRNPRGAGMDLFLGKQLAAKKPPPAIPKPAHPSSRMFFSKIDQLTLTRKACASAPEPHHVLNWFLHTSPRPRARRLQKKAVGNTPNSNSIFFTKPQGGVFEEEEKASFPRADRVRVAASCLGDGDRYKTLERLASSCVVLCITELPFVGQVIARQALSNIANMETHL